MGFSFGSSASGSASSPFPFGSSSGPVFSFASGGATAPHASNPAPVFGLPSPAVGFGSTLANDQMNDVNMTDDTNQSVTALAQTFAAFQLGSHQIPVAPQNPSPSTFGQPATPPPPAQPFGFGSPAIQPGVYMAEDTNQSVTALAQTFAAFQLGSPQNTPLSTFGQPDTRPPPPPSQPFVFGSPAIQPGGLPAFRFGNHQNPAAPQNPSPFQSPGNVEFKGWSFSSGSEDGGDTPSRKYLRVRRYKLRRWK